MTIMKRLMITLGFLGALMTGVNAAEINVHVGPETGINYLILTGPVEVGDSAKLKEMLVKYPETTAVAFHSPGGVAYEGFAMAQVMSDNLLNSLVPTGSICLSACAIAFIGGAEYTIDGALGFHSSYLPDPGSLPSSVAFKEGQAVGVQDTFFFLANGFSVQLPQLISLYTSPEDFLVFYNESQLDEFFMRDEEDNINSYLSFPVDVDENWLETRIMGVPQMVNMLGYTDLQGDPDV